MGADILRRGGVRLRYSTTATRQGGMEEELKKISKEAREKLGNKSIQINNGNRDLAAWKRFKSGSGSAEENTS